MMYWKNSAFQTLTFIASRCNTADEAYRRILLALEDREQALKKNESSRLRAEAKLEKAQFEAENAETTWDKKLACADINEIEADLKYNANLEQGTKEEISFLKLILNRLEHHRKYTHLSLSDSFEKAQRAEWLHEFIRRAENYIASEGRIPPTQLDAMRSHPDFKDIIYPIVKQLSQGKSADVPKPDTSFRACLEPDTLKELMD